MSFSCFKNCLLGREGIKVNARIIDLFPAGVQCLSLLFPCGKDVCLKEQTAVCARLSAAAPWVLPRERRAALCRRGGSTAIAAISARTVSAWGSGAEVFIRGTWREEGA